MCVYVGQWHAVWSLCIKWCKWHHRVNRSQCSLNMNMSPWNMNMSPCSLNKNMSPWNKYEHFFMQSEHEYVTMWSEHVTMQSEHEYVTIQSQHEHVTILLVNLSQFIWWSVCNHEHILLWTCYNLFCEQFQNINIIFWCEHVTFDSVWTVHKHDGSHCAEIN